MQQMRSLRYFGAIFDLIARARILNRMRAGSQCNEVARSASLASMLYASPAWWGFTTAQDRDRLERLMGRLRRGVFSRLKIGHLVTWLRRLTGSYLGL